MWQKVIEWVDKVASKLDFLGLCDSIKKIEISYNKIEECNTCKADMLAEHRKLLEAERRKVREADNLFTQVLNHLPDMLWAKNMKGEYIMANKAFMKNFCYGMTWDELQGKTDIEIAKWAKAKVGDENHTFGEKCANSDEIVKKTEKARRFLELGNIDGKLMKLEVHKSPVYNLEGIMYAVCGTGRDITEIHNELMDAIEASDTCLGEDGRNFLKAVANKYEFKDS